MGEEHLLDLLRIDVLAALYDHLLRSTDQFDSTGLVHAGHVAVGKQKSS